MTVCRIGFAVLMAWNRQGRIALFEQHGREATAGDFPAITVVC
jgi:hypothetical protein